MWDRVIKNNKNEEGNKVDVVYFDQHFGAADFKCLSKYAFSHFFHKNHKKDKKSMTIDSNLGKKHVF